MKKVLLAFFLFFCVPLAVPSFAGADAVLRSQIKGSFRLPNSNWTWNDGYTGGHRLLAMRIEKPEGGVSIAVNYYETSEGAKEFLSTLRDGATEAPVYRDADVQMVTPQSVDGKAWQMFKINGSGGGVQEVWVRNVKSNLLLDIMYSAANHEDFEQYRKDAMAILKQASSL
ncbi:MAG: hypothetical protein U1F57_07775 [bacterium]